MKINAQSFLPLIGNSSAAISSFAFSILFLNTNSKEVYAIFSFSIVFTSFLQTVINSTFVLPFFSKLACKYKYDRNSNFILLSIFLVPVLLLYFCMLRYFDLGFQDSIYLSLSIWFSTLRFYLRSLLIQRAEYNFAYSGDVYYLAVSLLLCLFSFYYLSHSFNFFLFLLSSFLSFLFYRDEIRFPKNARRIPIYFILNFRKYGINSFESAIYSEVLVSGISFVIMYRYGAQDYALFSVILLYFRPFTLVLNSINQVFKTRLVFEPASRNSFFSIYMWVCISALLISSSVFLVSKYVLKFPIVLSVDFFLFLSVFLLMLVRVFRLYFTIVMHAFRNFSALSESLKYSSISCLVVMIVMSFSGLNFVFVVLCLVAFEFFIALNLKIKMVR